MDQDLDPDNVDVVVHVANLAKSSGYFILEQRRREESLSLR